MKDWDFRSAGFFRTALQNNGARHLSLSARVAGTVMRGILDTGASSTVVDIETARRLALPLEPLEETGGGAGAARLNLWRINAPLEIEGREIAPPKGLYAMDLSHVAKALQARGLEAPTFVLGADVLLARAAIIDYGAEALYLRERPEADAA